MTTELYVIRAGDSLSGIARRAYASLDELLAINPSLAGRDRVSPGDTILVPEGALAGGFHAAMAEDADPGPDPVWYKIARREMVPCQAVDPSRDPRITEYIETCERAATADGPGGEAACSAFVNWCIEQSNMDGTDSVAARSWLDEHWGTDEPTDRPRTGAIAVFSRTGERGEGGHVGFLVVDRGTEIEILAGGSREGVCRQTCPRDGEVAGQRYRLLGYRWPN